MTAARKREPRPHRELISQDELMTWLKISQRAKLEAWLKAESVPFFHTSGGLCTTVEAVNEALRVEKHRARANIEF